MVGVNNGIGRRTFLIINGVAMFLVCVVTLYPFLYIAAASLSDPVFISRGEIGIIPKGLNFRAYRMVANYPMIWRSYWNTIVYTVVGTFINIFGTVFAAYPLSRKSFIARKFWNLFIFFPMLFHAGLIPQFVLVNGLNMRDTIWALVIPGAISSYYVIIMRTFFDAIPSALEESARIDGASHFTILLRIILPLSLPSLVTVGMFYAVGHWNSFFSAMMYLNDQSKLPLQIMLRNLVIQNQTDIVVDSTADDRAIVGEAVKYATIIAATLPILVVYPFIQKYFVQGVMIGSVKG